MRDRQRPAREGQRHDRVAVPLVVPAKIRVPAPDALPRERLEVRLAHAWRHRLTLVVAPAGSGKTTLVARFAAQAGVPVGWYRAETWDADEASFVRHIEAALRSALPDLPGGWTSIEDVAKALETRPAPAALLVIDDGHALEGTAAEAALGRLVDYAPPWLAVIVAVPRAPVDQPAAAAGVGRPPRARAGRPPVPRLGGRAAVPRHLPRPRAAGRPRGARAPHRGLGRGPAAVPPRDPRAVRGRAATGPLRRRDERPAPARVPGAERAVRAARGPAPVPRRHLRARPAVRADVRPAARDDGERCAARRALAPQRVHRARSRTTTAPSATTRSCASTSTGCWSRRSARPRPAPGMPRAGDILEADGALPEALRAYCRAEDWVAVRRLLGGQGERLAATERAGWVDAVPPAIERHDPWVALAAARRARNDGRWSAAIDGYIRAESVFGPSRAADAPRRERQRIAAWLDPVAMPTPDARRGPAQRARPGAGRWGARRGAAGRPAGAGRSGPAPPRRGRGGQRAPAARPRRRRRRGGADRVRGRTARRGGGRTARRRRMGRAGAMDRAIEDAERAGSPWLARLGRALAVRLGPGVRREAGVPRATAPGDDAGQDPWGAALLDLAEAWASAGDPERRARRGGAATGSFRRLGAGVLEAWARGLARSAARASARPTRARPPSRRSRRVARRDRRRRACSRTPRSPTSTRCAAPTTRCSRIPSPPRRGSSCRAHRDAVPLGADASA